MSMREFKIRATTDIFSCENIESNIKYYEELIKKRLDKIEELNNKESLLGLTQEEEVERKNQNMQLNFNRGDLAVFQEAFDRKKCKIKEK